MHAQHFICLRSSYRQQDTKSAFLRRKIEVLNTEMVDGMMQSKIDFRIQAFSAWRVKCYR
jgi:hypothetical protein